MQKNHAKRTALALFLLFAVTVSAQAAKIAEVIPIGHTVGIKMQAEGVLIVQLTEVQGADGTHSPAKEAGVQEGDVLCRAGETALHSNDDLQKQVALSAGQPIKLTLERGDAEKSVTVTPCRDKTGAYRIGVLARDSLAGIGTLTYVDPQTGAFGSLGHGICDSETGVLLPLQEGTIIHSTVSSVQRGKAGEPGSLQGEFSTEKPLGTVAQNTESGIFGTITDDSLYGELQCVPVASADEIKIGDAEILSNVDGDSVQRYYLSRLSSSIRRTTNTGAAWDPPRDRFASLPEKTGGIVQGMSGSPILQNGKLIGAVTHVLVDNPMEGYGISMEKMLAAG